MNTPQTFVGAGLLAKRTAQSTKVSTVPAPSRASPLPQSPGSSVIGSRHKSRVGFSHPSVQSARNENR
ncbi:hypothetical protein EGM97_01115 [Pseudomonas sp. AF32]|nr:hypothetical protein [Pseudomonas sp. AF32]